MTDAVTPAAHAAGAPAVASPLATGDYGGRFQDAVGGWFLAKLLVGEAVSDIPGEPATVGFQRALHGAVLDDVVFNSTTGTSAEFSIKASVAVRQRDRELVETLTRAWQRHQADRGGLNGLIAPPTAIGISDLAQLVFLARQHAILDDFMRATTTPGTVSAGRRRRYAACRTILDRANDAPLTHEQFHVFLQRFVVVTLDFAIPGRGALEPIYTSLSAARGISREQARVLFDRLVAIGEEATIASRQLTAPLLLERLQHDGVELGLAAAFEPDVAALDAYARRTFESRRDTVAGVRLDRAGTVEAIVTALGNGTSALLGGPSGFGKSAVLREVYERLSTDGPVLHLSGRRIASAASWPALADDIGIPRDRDRLAEVLATNGRGVTVLLDALEHVQTPPARALVNDLLRDLGAHGARVVLVTSDLLVADVLRWLDITAIPSLERITLNGLEAANAARIGEAAPALRPLIARVQGRRIPGGLVVIDLLHNTRIPAAALDAAPATEADLLDIWWEHVVVGDDPDRHARRAVARAAADAVSHVSGALFQLPNGLDGGAINALTVDGVLVLDAPLDAYRFGHDIIQDWAIVRYIDSAGANTEAQVSALAQASGFYRSVTLFAQRLAERDPARFDVLLSQLENANDQRGVQAFLSALALSTRARDLLNARAAMLLENGAARLTELLNVIRTEQVDINIGVIDYAREHNMDIGTAILGGVMYGAPRYAVWIAVLDFCIRHLNALSRATLPFVQMADRWQQTTPPGTPLRARLFAATMQILAQLERWRQREAAASEIAIRYEDADAIEKTARSASAHAADVDPTAIAVYLDDLRENGYDNAQDDMLAHAGILGRVLTDEIVAYVVSVLSEPERRPWESDFSELGLSAHTYYPSSDLQGPFLALLRNNEVAGLAVVRQLAARALAYYEREADQGELSRESAHLRPLTFAFRGREVTLRGDERVYTWFRAGVSDDSSVLTSALMALDTWAFESVGSGRDPIEIVDAVLTSTECVAFLGIAVRLAYDIAAIIPELADVVAQPWLWRLEFFREQRDAMPDDVNGLLPAEWQMPVLRPDLRNRNREREVGRLSRRHPAHFVATYLFVSSAETRRIFVDRATASSVEYTCLWIEEQDRVQESTAAQEDFDLFRSFVNPDNYERTGKQIAFRAPPQMEQRADGQQAALARAGMIAAGLVAANALRDYAPPSTMRSAAFDQIGQELEATLSAGTLNGDDERYARDGVVRCAGVAVTFGPQDGVPASPWATNVIFEAARAEDGANWSPDRDDESALDERIGIATALGALLAADLENSELRLLAFRAAALGPPKVGASVLRGLTPVWATRPRLALNVFFLLIEAALRDGDIPQSLIETYEAAEREGSLGTVPAVDACSSVAMYRLERVLPALPHTFLGTETLDVLVEIAQQLLTIARSEETEDDRQFRFSFAWEVGHFASDVFVSLPTVGYAAFRASVTDWTASLDVFGEEVLGMIYRHIGMYDMAEGVVERFSELAESFLNADHRAQLDRPHLSSGFQKTCCALVFFGSIQGSIINADWPHAGRFTEHIGRWVRAVGGHPTTATALVAFLDRFAAAFSTALLIEWISISVEQTAERNRPEFWRRNGESIGALLLRLRNERSGDFGDRALRRSAAAIADALVTAGVALAGEVRQAFEAETR